MALHIFHKWGLWRFTTDDSLHYMMRSCGTCGLVQHKRIWTRGA